MPRNAAGVYTLPNPPRVPNTVIDSPDENVTRDDLATELTNSLDRNGRGGMLAPFRIADGTLAAPGLAFLNEPGTGLYRQSPGVAAFAVQGAKVMEFTAAQISIPAPVQFLVATLATQGNIKLNGWLSKSGNNEGLSFDATDNANFTKSLSVNGALALGIGLIDMGSGAPTDRRIVPSTADGADNIRLFLCGGGGSNDITRGSFIGVYGNESASQGAVDIAAGDGAAGLINFYTGNGNLQVSILKTPGSNRSLTLQGAVGPNNPTISTFGGGLVGFGVGIAIPAGQGIYLDGGFDTVMLESSPNVIQFLCGGVTSLVLRQPGVGIANVGTGLSIPSGQAFYFDAGSDTLILESAPDTMMFQTGGASRMLIRNTFINFEVGVSIPPAQGFYLDGGSDTNIQEVSPNVIALQTGGSIVHQFSSGGYTMSQAGGTPALTMNSVAAAGQGPFIRLQRGGVQKGILGVEAVINGTNNDAMMLFSESNLKLAVGGTATPRLQITAAGYTRISSDGNVVNINGNYHEMFNNSANGYVCVFSHSNNPSPTGLLVQYTGADPNSAAATQFFIDFFGLGNRRAAIASNGGLHNYQANDVNLSDMTVKNSWAPYTPTQLEALSAAVSQMQYGRFKFLDQTHDDWNHGYIAQNVREAFYGAADELVEALPWGESDEKKNLLSVYSTDLVNINLAVAQHEIKKLKAEIADLKARIH